jgi:hypothetical protein
MELEDAIREVYPELRYSCLYNDGWMVKCRYCLATAIRSDLLKHGENCPIAVFGRVYRSRRSE